VRRGSVKILYRELSAQHWRSLCCSISRIGAMLHLLNVMDLAILIATENLINFITPMLLFISPCVRLYAQVSR